METVAKPNRNAALESDSDDDMPLSDRLQSPSKPLNGAKEGAASPDRAAPLQPKVPGGQAAQAGGAAGLSGNPAGAEAKSAGASGKAPSDKGKASSEPKSKAEAYAAAAKPAGASQAGPSKASGGAKAGPSKASDGAKAGSSKASDGAQAGPSKASDGAKAGSSKASDGAQAGPSKASHGAKAGSSKAMEPGKTVGSQKAGLSKQAAMAGRSSSAGANGKASGAALAANGSLKRKASPVSDSSDSEDDQPLAARKAAMKTPAKKPPAKKPQTAQPAKKAAGEAPKRKPPVKKPAKRKRSSDDSEDEESSEDEGPSRAAGGGRRSSMGGRRSKKDVDGKELKWETLEHSGVLFPPEYKAHGVKMLYDGAPVELTVAQEEVATMAASMVETDYFSKDTFLKNFWEGFKKVLGPSHKIKSLEKCDFRPIYEHLMAEREAKKSLSKEDKAAQKADKDAMEAKYKFAMVDGRKEQVGNFRVEPPGLFRGRGEHPKMGRIKRRIYPRDITINIGAGVPVPGHAYEGQKWKEVRHDRTVTWLAFWKDPISDNQYKYVWLAANSAFKASADQEKYEKARKLKGLIDKIRRVYESDWDSNDYQAQQMGVAMYFIDKLALRAGHEKEEDEADTVGCCNLKVSNVECLEGDHIKFDFLGKDSIRYENEVKAHPKVWRLVEKFCRKDGGNKDKEENDQLFETMDANDLNKRMKDFMPDLSVKVFRTYNASIVLDKLLYVPSESDVLDAKKADYDRANKEVAILCNHQRSVPKGHAGQMVKLTEKMEKMTSELVDLERELEAAKKGKTHSASKVQNPDSLRNKISKKKEQISKAEINAQVKDDLKTVALGTSKINYLDPRITVAWCKRHEVPIEKVFNKSLLSKFFWAMDCNPEFKF